MLKKHISILMTLILFLTFMATTAPVYISAATDEISEGCNIDNFSYDFTTVDDEVVSSNSEGVVTILVFARTNTTCTNSLATIGGLCNGSWIEDERIRLIIVDIDKEPKETVVAMRDKYAESPAFFCYCENRYASNAMWSYADSMAGISGTISLPVTVIIDNNNKAQYCLVGSQSETNIRHHVEELLGEKLVEEQLPQDKIDVYIEGQYNEKMSYEVFEQVNAARKEEGLSALKLDKTLSEKAMERAAECAVYYSHTRPNGDICFTILDDNYLSSCAENIACGYSTAENVMAGWLNSTGHYNNIMGDYTNIGVGSYTHNGVTYWVQMFSTYGQEEKQQQEDYINKQKISLKIENLGTVSLGYEGVIEERIIKETNLKIQNIGSSTYYVPSFDNIEFSSNNEPVICVEPDGRLFPLSPGEGTIIVKLDGYPIGLFPVIVNSSGTSQPDSGTTEKPGDTPTQTPSTGTLKGDVTGDGKVSLADAQKVLKAALGIIRLEDESIADASGDNKVNLPDAQLVLKAALGIIQL